MTDNTQTEEIIFFCKDCQEIVKTNRCGRKYVYTCDKCGTKNVAFGTKKSIYSYFRLEDEGKSERKTSLQDMKSKSRAPTELA